MIVLAEASGGSDFYDWINCLEEDRPVPVGVDSLRLDRCMGLVAEALGAVHRSDIPLTEKQTIRSELAGQRRSFELIRSLDPELTREIERMLGRLESLAQDEEPLVPSHGGFRHRQVLGDDRSVTLLDWDGLTLAHPALDAATFLRGLRWEPITQPGRFGKLDRLAGVFRQHFLRCHPTVDRRSLALYEALLLSQGALREFHRSKGGAECVHRLLAAAERLLDENTEPEN